MAGKSTIDDKQFRKAMKKLDKYIEHTLGPKAFREFKKNTPKDSGNARRKTRIKKTQQGSEIVADYDYAGVLDKGLYPKNPKTRTGKTSNGFSTQAPEGMVKPTMEFVERDIDKFIRRQ